MSASLVGSEMCIRDSNASAEFAGRAVDCAATGGVAEKALMSLLRSDRSSLNSNITGHRTGNSVLHKHCVRGSRLS
eukprot:8145065-Alexandrium_andersonii.AAC.1